MRKLRLKKVSHVPRFIELVSGGIENHLSGPKAFAGQYGRQDSSWLNKL